MRISRLHIERFRAIDELHIPFCDEFGQPREVVTLAGPNGAGKTTVLYAITNALRGIFGYRTDDVPEPNRDDIRSAVPNSSWTSTPNRVKVSVDIHFSRKEQDDIRETLELLEKQPPPQLPNDTLTVTWTFPPGLGPDGERLPWHYSDISPSVPGVRSWIQVKQWAIRAWRERVPGVASQVGKLGGLYFFPQDRDLRHRVVGEVDNSHEETLSKRQSNGDKWTVHDVLDDFSRRFANVPEDDETNWESLVKRLYRLICAPKEYCGFRYREDTPLGSPVFADGGIEYPLSHAASGEHVIMEYIIGLCRFGPLNRSIVLIDEPEVHLHPLWLRRFYLGLPQMGSDNQFVLTRSEEHTSELQSL